MQHTTETRTASATVAEDRDFVLGAQLRATILATGEETEGRHDLTLGVMPPGAMTPLHLHTRYDERFWLLSGSMTVWAGLETVTLGPDDFYAIPRKVVHTLRAGPDGARALQISSPAAFAELVARAGTPARLATQETQLDTDAFFAVATELGDVILGHPGMTPGDLADTAEQGA
jgi:mannose-6-phosphate isomerase-like protein (cupin superfamily)